MNFVVGIHIVDEKLYMRKKITRLVLVSLAFLFVFSPCKARHYIPSDNALPLTEFSGRFKAPVISNCSTPEFADSSLISNTISNHFFSFHTEGISEFSFRISDTAEPTVFSRIGEIKPANHIPLYILYKTLRVFCKGPFS